MSGLPFLSALGHRFADFLAFRRLGGIDSKSDLALLHDFDRFLAQQEFRGPCPTRELITDYLASIGHLNPRTQQNRLSLIRQFCCYLCQFEPQCFVPEDILSRQPPRLRDAHIYSETEIQAILQAARTLPPPDSLRPKTYATLFGLLYTTGLRCGEAFALNLSDVNLVDHVLFIQKGKFGKSRWVPISPSTAQALDHYLEERSRAAPPSPQSPFFITRNAGRLYHTNVELAFRQVLERCGLRGGKGCPGPRLHYLRHSFACNRVLAWYREGKDVNALLPVLATYLGHVSIASTQVYLHASAELLEQASERFHKKFRQNLSPRVIAYYEAESQHPPAALLVYLARALNVSTDILLGVAETPRGTKASSRLERRLKRIETLEPRARRQLVQLIDTFIEAEEIKKRDSSV